MKITIVETEIHEAIRAHINSQIAVKAGHDITIELRATRGEEGFIANIDISPSKNAQAEQVMVPETQALTETTAPTKPNRITRAPKPQQTPVEAQEWSEEVHPEITDSPFEADTAVSTETIGDPEPDGVEEVEGSQPLKARSIFANLPRPTNDPATQAA